MLVLTRKIGESIIIEDNLGNPIATITLADLQNNRARIGLTADQGIRFRRAELPAMPSQSRTNQERPFMLVG